MDKLDRLINKVSLEILTDCTKKEKYIYERIHSLEQQERLYKERLEEVRAELHKAKTDLALAKVEHLGATKALEGIEYDNGLVSNIVEKGDRVVIVNNKHILQEEEIKEYIGQIGTVINIHKDHQYPYEVEFDNVEYLNNYLWKREELEFAKERW